MKLDRTEIVEVIHTVIDEFNEQMPQGPHVDKAGSAVLFGRNGSLDSLALVHFVIGVEQRVNDTFGTEITLASEKAMAQRRSPFRNVDSLVDFVHELLQETTHE